MTDVNSVAERDDIFTRDYDVITKSDDDKDDEDYVHRQTSVLMTDSVFGSVGLRGDTTPNKPGEASVDVNESALELLKHS